MAWQGATGPNPRKSRESESEERNHTDKNTLENAPVFIPARGFCELFQHRCEEALEVELLVDSQNHHETREYHPEPIGSAVDTPRAYRGSETKNRRAKVCRDGKPTDKSRIANPGLPSVNLHERMLASGPDADMGNFPR